MKNKIKAGDVVEYLGVLWNVSQVHISDRSADIWRQKMYEGRVNMNVALSDLQRVTS